MTDFDDTDLGTADCPACGRSMCFDADRCPHCGDYVTPGAARRHPLSWWMWVGIVLAFAVMTLWVLAT